jgi:NAD-dependent histone deacetylase SIR2
MGQEHSSLVDDDTPAETLRERSLEAVAEYINSGRARRIVVMTGAGISTAAGSMPNLNPHAMSET